MPGLGGWLAPLKMGLRTQTLTKLESFVEPRCPLINEFKSLKIRAYLEVVLFSNALTEKNAMIQGAQ